MALSVWGRNVSFNLNIQQQETGNVQVLLADLKACSRTRNLEKGKQIHAEAIAYGRDSSIRIASALINMYARCGSMLDARQVFDNMKHQNVVCWTALILGYAENGQGLTAMEMFTRMKCAPDAVTFVAVLKACISLALNNCVSGWTKAVHNLVVEFGCDLNIYVQSSLMDMYAKCGRMVDAREIFDSMKHTNVVSWNVLILGYVHNGQCLAALDLFIRMKTGGPAPDSLTYVSVLKACTSLKCRDRGKEIHDLAVENGCTSNIYVGNTLIDMYSKCGSMLDARQVFDNMKHQNVVSWTALILGYAENGQGLVSLDLFARMKSGGPAPNYVTVVAALKACISLRVKGESGRLQCRAWGKVVYDLAVEGGLDLNNYVQSTMIDMYSKCGSMVHARQVFDSMKHPNVVSWTALILGYADNGQGLAAMDLFVSMESLGPPPNSVTFAAALKACALLGALDFGRRIHAQVQSGHPFDVLLVNCLVDFYAKCGSLVEAKSIFDLHTETRDVITWNALLAGFSSRGDHVSLFGLFEQMEDAGIRPDSITFISILTCCSHAGLVEKGRECFKAMLAHYRIIPTVEHYNCMVDILGRANKLDNLMALLETLPCSPDDVTWRIILCACCKWKNVEIGRLAFQSLNNRDASDYVLMGHIYASRGMLQDQETMKTYFSH